MITRTKQDVAAIMERFVDGVGAKWEWDDFCSSPTADPKLEAVRAQCTNLSFTHPSVEKEYFCSEDGIRLLQELTQKLRAPRSLAPRFHTQWPFSEILVTLTTRRYSKNSCSRAWNVLGLLAS